MKLLASVRGYAVPLLMVAGCAGQRGEPTHGGQHASEGVDMNALAAAPSQPVRVGRTRSWYGHGEDGHGVVGGAVGAVQGFLETRPAETDPPSLLECLLERSSFRTFVALLVVTNLDAELTRQPYTVLVPNDRAFQRLPLQRRIELFEIGDPDLLGDALRRHVIRGVYSADDLAKAGQLTTLAGTRIHVEPVGGQPVLDDAQLLSSRRLRSGMMHEIDRVLLE